MVVNLKYLLFIGISFCVLGSISCSEEKEIDSKASTAVSLDIEKQETKQTSDTKEQVVAEWKLEATARAKAQSQTEKDTNSTTVDSIKPASNQSALLTDLSNWHEKWENTPSMNAQENLIGELLSIVEPYMQPENIIRPATLGLKIDTYIGTHMLFSLLRKNITLRSRMFATNMGLGDSMEGVCDLPDKANVPEVLQRELTLLNLECGTTVMFSDHLLQVRKLSGETWLKDVSSLNTGSNEDRISEEVSELLSLIATWHLNWKDISQFSVQEDMITKLLDIVGSPGDILDEPLASEIQSYFGNHLLFTEVSSDQRYRAYAFASESGLGESMRGPCDLPAKEAVSEELQTKLSILGHQCNTVQLFNRHVFNVRKFAEDTWLKSNLQAAPGN